MYLATALLSQFLQFPSTSRIQPKRVILRSSARSPVSLIHLLRQDETVAAFAQKRVRYFSSLPFYFFKKIVRQKNRNKNGGKKCESPIKTLTIGKNNKVKHEKWIKKDGKTCNFLRMWKKIPPPTFPSTKKVKEKMIHTQKKRYSRHFTGFLFSFRHSTFFQKKIK